MNSISRFLVSIFYNFWFDLKLKRIIKIYRHKVVNTFDLIDSKDSYWVEFDEQHACLPQNVEEHKEFDGSLKEQTKIMMKSWQYFDTSVQKDFEGLLKYVAWLRKNYSNKKQQHVQQNQVSDHIYEM